MNKSYNKNDWEISVRSSQSSARILACTTGVIRPLIGVFVATRETREGRENKNSRVISSFVSTYNEKIKRKQ